MKTTKTICDRCGGEIKAGNKLVTCEGLELFLTEKSKWYDLCYACYKKFEKWITQPKPCKKQN